MPELIQKGAMKTFLLLCALLIVGQQAWADDDCDFDQVNRVKENLNLKAKYPGSYLTDKNLVLVIPRENKLVRINIGGCVHNGISIELETTNINDFVNEADFMKEILFLAKTYSQGEIDPSLLGQVIKKRDWVRPEPKSKDRFYFFKYDPPSTFEVYERRNEKRLIVGLNYYY